MGNGLSSYEIKSETMFSTPTNPLTFSRTLRVTTFDDKLSFLHILPFTFLLLMILPLAVDISLLNNFHDGSESSSSDISYFTAVVFTAVVFTNEDFLGVRIVSHTWSLHISFTPSIKLYPLMSSTIALLFSDSADMINVLFGVVETVISDDGTSIADSFIPRLWFKRRILQSA